MGVSGSKVAPCAPMVATHQLLRDYATRVHGDQAKYLASTDNAQWVLAMALVGMHIPEGFAAETINAAIKEIVHAQTRHVYGGERSGLPLFHLDRVHGRGLAGQVRVGRDIAALLALFVGKRARATPAARRAAGEEEVVTALEAAGLNTWDLPEKKVAWA